MRGADGGVGEDGSVGTGARARSIGNGDLHSCAVIEDGTVRCWGWNSSGQLGTDDMFPTGPVQVPGIQDAIAVAGEFEVRNIRWMLA